MWAFAAAGAAFGLAQFLLYAQIAASKRAAIYVLWGAVVVLVGTVWVWHSSILQIVLIVLAVALSVAFIGMLELLFERRSEKSEIAVAHGS